MGEIEDQDNYRTNAKTQLGQKAFKTLLSCDATNQYKKGCNNELYSLFKNVYHGDKAYNVVIQSLADKYGNKLDPSEWR
eukprot:8489815-Ditylum_brightwellii.AAC.1